ncbi:hypothetical protein ACP4OV_000696 [Aristida adscensionis]
MEGSISKPSAKRVALVTGGNRGMGFEICRQLASNGLAVVLTARSAARGAEAVAKLQGLRPLRRRVPRAGDHGRCQRRSLG